MFWVLRKCKEINIRALARLEAHVVSLFHAKLIELVAEANIRLVELVS
jgi:hypothetical protein